MKAWTDEECAALWENSIFFGAWMKGYLEPMQQIRLLIRAAVDEARREFHETVLAEADKHPGCCHHVSDAILARDKEPRDAER